MDFGLQPEQPYNAPVEDDSSHSICYPSSITNNYDHLDDLEYPFPDFGFSSEFGPKSVHPVQESGSISSMFESIDDLAAMAENVDNLRHLNVAQTNKAFAPSNYYPSARGRYPIVNPTHMRDNFDNASNVLSGTYSCYEFDAVNGSTLEVGPSQLSILDHPSQAECSSLRSSLSDFQDAMSVMERLSISKPSSSSSRISTIFGKMSLSPSSRTSASDFLAEVDSPFILPGVFPEYCWQHINQNKLCRCSHRDGTQKCDSKRHPKSTPMHRSLRADILSRIIERTIRAADMNEIDTFGNSTMLAPPSYLISLVNLGAMVNSLNNAGQIFLHLVKPEVLNYSDDFCYLLEILSIQGFNFCWHDHLGQSPLHLLMRSWIDPDILRKVSTKLDSLPDNSHFSTAQDCLGYTVVGQMNLQGTQSALIDFDQAILSLAYETEKPIIDPKDLQTPKGKGRRIKSSGKDEQPARNHENHPPIKTVENLFQYEQHVDYWRTIVAAKDSPWFEDSNRRNGLHCLAEASLVLPDMPLPGLLLNQVDALTETGHTDNNSDQEWFIKCLLNVGVDPNNYDNEGNTPLMAFIIHRRAAENDDCTTRILSYLVEAGSDISRRNRRGETALHMAVKLRRRAATKVLLTSGASIHARRSSCLGVLELGQKHSIESKQDENLYAQIILSMSLAASFGAVSGPTILDEWASPHGDLVAIAAVNRKA